MAPEGIPSELSDLELDHKAPPVPETAEVKEEEVEDIEPDHYYGGGKIPVFKPVSPLHVPDTKLWRYCTFLRDWLTGGTLDHGPISRLPGLHQENRQIRNAGRNRESGSSKRMVS